MCLRIMQMITKLSLMYVLTLKAIIFIYTYIYGYFFTTVPLMLKKIANMFLLCACAYAGIMKFSVFKDINIVG